jgi:hypothetical protein
MGSREKDKTLGWIEGRENHLTRRGRGAETSDRIDREAWPGRFRGSAYHTIVNLPDGVQAGDTQTARAIMDRIEAAIDQGGWTTNEWVRLHKLQKAWARRQAGADPVFNMRGWQKKGSGHNLNPTLKALKEIGLCLGNTK